MGGVITLKCYTNRVVHEWKVSSIWDSTLENQKLYMKKPTATREDMELF